MLREVVSLDMEIESFEEWGLRGGCIGKRTRGGGDLKQAKLAVFARVRRA